MIKTLYIKNFILIDELLLEFKNGFNVLLGETGAGKSIIIKAIDTVLGAKTSKDVLKDDNKHALIEVVFENNGEEKVISREISTTGTKCRLNGALVNLETIKSEREQLIDIHTQFQTYTYIQQKYHIDLLDSYIQTKEKQYKDIVNSQQKEYTAFQELSKKLEKLKTQSNTNQDKIEFLKFQIDEIEKADIKENEEDELNSEMEVLSNIQELKDLSYSSYWALGGQDGSITEVLGKIGYNVSQIKNFDKELSPLEENFFNALEILRDISSELRNYSENLEDNPERLDEVNERLELIQKLKRKYGNIFESYEKFTEELKNLEEENLSYDEIEEEIEKLQQSMKTNCEKISLLRKKYANELSSILKEELKKLEFECPEFIISIEESQLSQKGEDYVEFLITTNAAKAPAPLVKVASGGEISRVMLAIKTVFAQVDNIQTIVLDEIDTGISGKTSVSVANEIFELSKTVQVFAITHQPIIASKAQNALLVSKTQGENNTFVNVKPLNIEEKIKVLARMSSGVVDEKSINFAKELVSKGVL